jgi:hypothetical protein
MSARVESLLRAQVAMFRDKINVQDGAAKAATASCCAIARPCATTMHELLTRPI